jgi:alanine-glyoxylate transaminase/serine-glyoxylate transaminase/serine-pyruvate transaminase
MSLLPDVDRILLGPGPSLTAPRVMRAMAAPTISHLDPLMMRLLDDVRGRLGRVFRAGEGSFAFAVSGTGTSGMETAVANLVREGSRVSVVVSGYFGDRLAQMCQRYGATVSRLDVEWGRACDPAALRAHLDATPADIVAMVHAETSTGVLNPLRELSAIAHEHGALTIVDAVTSLGAMPLEVDAWGIDACYSCTQKGLGGPSGLAPVVFGPRALEKRVTCRSFYFDLSLLEDYWLRRKYHHTMSSTLVYALYEALSIIEEEGLETRWARHERNHRTLVTALAPLGLSMLPPEPERLWTLNAVRVPAAVDDAAVRLHLLNDFNIEIGAGLGPLAGKIWRVGLMGASSSPALIVLLRGALESALARQGAMPVKRSSVPVPVQ